MTVYYNEIDPFCVKVLRKQIAAGNLPHGVVDDRDIREVQPEDLRGFRQVHLFAGIGGIPLGFKWAGVPDDFNIWTGGFPCQDISVAGRRAGIEGSRSGLWSEFARIVRILRPRYVLVENVPNLTVRGIDRVLGDLAACGYDTEWQCLPAVAFGAPHIRDRIFIVAHADRQRHRAPQGTVLAGWDAPEPCGWWLSEPPVGRVVDGIPGRVDRLRGLGNAVVPQVAEYIARRLAQRPLPLGA